ncbi:hypothetical protein EV182_005637 [Spiromyces aspiralis]|uniref:Uncharacterized protein n=1 Tax=Spiromyces aspiralis TaxID=68401 RepID=A0ACC1HDQ2_9FUNG|nr:hypothetical protein EV182_005637 [Spiromyces aspiralis]
MTASQAFERIKKLPGFLGGARFDRSNNIIEICGEYDGVYMGKSSILLRNASILVHKCREGDDSNHRDLKDVSKITIVNNNVTVTALYYDDEAIIARISRV